MREPVPEPGIAVRLSAVADDLDDIGRSWALVGALALGVHARPRATLDADIALIVRDDTDANHFAKALQGRGYVVLEASVHPTLGHFTSVRVVSPVRAGGRLVVDFMFDTTGIEKEIVTSAERLAVTRDLQVPVATRGHLIAMKVLSQGEDRPQDSVDLQQLLRRATTKDLDEARTALRLIRERDHDGGKDLLGALESAVAHLGPNGPSGE
jgi:predicted nucleotidyltransferase